MWPVSIPCIHQDLKYQQPLCRALLIAQCSHAYARAHLVRPLGDLACIYSQAIKYVRHEAYGESQNVSYRDRLSASMRQSIHLSAHPPFHPSRLVVYSRWNLTVNRYASPSTSPYPNTSFASRCFEKCKWKLRGASMSRDGGYT